MDDYLRKRAAECGAKLINGLFMRMDQEGTDGAFTIHYNAYEEGSKVGTKWGVWVWMHTDESDCALCPE